MALAKPKSTPFEDQLAETFAGLKAGEGRRQAWEAFAARGLPHRRVEEWKWSDVRAALGEPREVSGPAPVDANGPFAADHQIVFSNGRLLNEPDLPAGARLHRQEDPGAPGLREAYPMAALAAAFGVTWVLEISETVEAPIALRIASAGEGMHHLRLAILVREGASATLLESHESSGAPFSNTLVEVGLQNRAQLHRYILQPEADSAVQTVTTLGQMGEDASYRERNLAFGGTLTRFDAHWTASADAARADLGGAYLLSGQRHADFTTVVSHEALNCQTRQIVKGVAGDKARGAFQGRFDVARGAQKTDAEMRHDALLLNEGAQVNAKPELMIFADDVECAHGNTIGAVDEDALFYMRARGVSEAEARALLIRAFVAEAFADTPELVQEVFIAQSDIWLGVNA